MLLHQLPRFQKKQLSSGLLFLYQNMEGGVFMNKFRLYVKRFCASIMICCIMFFTCMGDYLGVRSMDVYATGLEYSLLEVLMYLLEGAAGSYGYAYSSQADLQTSAQGLQYIIENYDYYEDSSDPINKLQGSVYDYLENITAGTYALEAQAFQAVKDYVFMQLSGNSSSVSTPTVLRLEKYADISDFNAYFSTVYDVSYRATGLTSDGEYYNYYIDGQFNPSIWDNKTSYILLLSSDGMGFSVFTPTYADSVLVYSSGYYLFYSPSCAGYSPVSYLSFQFKEGSDTEAYCTAIYSSGYFGKEGSQTVSYFKKNMQNTSSTIYPVTLPTSRIYTSTAEVSLYNYVKKAYSLSGKLYGSASSAKTYVTDEITGTVSIPVTGTYTAANVEQAVANALAENPSATQDDLDAVVAQIIASNEDVKDDIQESTTTLSTLIQQVKEIAQSNALSISEVYDQISEISVVNGTAAEKLESIADQFEVLEGGASSDSGGDNDDDPKIWVPVIPTVVKFLQPALEFLGDPLSEITKFLNKITDQIQEIPDNVANAFREFFGEIQAGITELPNEIANALGIDELPDNMADAFHEFFGEIVKGITELPDNIANALPSIDISFPSALDYTNILNQISSQIENLFLVDTDVLGDALSGFDDVWNEKIPFISSIAPLFDVFHFSDNYTYPVIKVQTPDILSSYYSDDYIVLLDFEDYKQYTLWARNIVKAWLWFCFGLSIVNHFRTNISIG